MHSQAFQATLEQMGYLAASRKAAPGLTLADATPHPRLRAVLGRDRGIGLDADAVFSAKDSPVAIFKDAGAAEPHGAQVHQWHEAAWNVGLAPLLWVVTPADVRIYDCYRSPVGSPSSREAFAPAMASYALNDPSRMAALDATCGRLATETGAFWSSQLGKKIDRRHRVDRELLEELRALEACLVDSMPRDSVRESPERARDLAQRFIGRCIFMRYLLDRDLAQPFLPSHVDPALDKLFETPESACRLFEWLHSTFNGDLFPMDDPGAEREHLTERSLEAIRDFNDGCSLILGQVGQRRLFQFRFDAIPISLISSIYEQFAASGAAGDVAAQGLHYTPVEVVHLVLDPVFEGLDSDARVLDPTCGSGAFLVESFRRLVWRKTRDALASRQLVRQILHRQLYGIEISRSALSIAAFSLYLAALELDGEPVEDLRDLRFDRLIGKTLFHADALGPLPAKLATKKFDAIVGNPPWTFVSSARGVPERAEPEWDAADKLPKRSRDWKFLHRAARMTKSDGRIGMVMQATPFFSVDAQAIAAREQIVERLQSLALINLSQLRRERLFPNVTGPALVVFARCEMTPESDRVLVGSIPWSPDFKRTGIFQIGPGDVRPVSIDRMRAAPALLKTAAFGTARDDWLMERLQFQRSFITLDEFLTDLAVLPRVHRGQGFQVGSKSAHKRSPREYFRLPLADSGHVAAFRVRRDHLGTFNHARLHRPRARSIFRGPLLLCPKAVHLQASGQPSRYCVSVSTDDLLYSESFFGISFAEASQPLVYFLSGILNSSLTNFQLAFGASSWGVERPTVHPRDLLSVRVPSLRSIAVESIRDVVEVEKRAARAPHREDLLTALDEAVYDLYDLEAQERVVLGESVDRVRALVSDSVAERRRGYEKPSWKDVCNYATQVLQTINPYLRARGTRHLEAIVCRDAERSVELSASVPGATAVRFVMVPGAPTEPIVKPGNSCDTVQLATRLHNAVDEEGAPYLNRNRLLRIYGDGDVFLVKPSQAKYWTCTAGLNDADTILSDHWYREPHGTVYQVGLPPAAAVFAA